MDFEKEMQKSLRVIFQNIQVIKEKRVEQNLPKFRNPAASRGKRKQCKLTSLSLTDLRNASESAGNSGSGMSST